MRKTMKNEKYGKAFYMVLATVALICAFLAFDPYKRKVTSWTSSFSLKSS